jgi:hypothetical protein
VALGVGLLATGWPADPTPLLPAVVATGLCLVSAVATLLLADAVLRAAPELGPAAVLGGTGVRLGVAAVGVVLFGDVMGRFGVARETFAFWVAYLYVVTLTAECVLLIRGLRDGRKDLGSGAARE